MDPAEDEAHITKRHPVSIGPKAGIDDIRPFMRLVLDADDSLSTIDSNQGAVWNLSSPDASAYHARNSVLSRRDSRMGKQAT